MSSSVTPASKATGETKKARKARERRVRDRQRRAMAAANKPPELADFELPEVELVRKSLEKEVGGRRIDTVEATSIRCLCSYYYRYNFTKPLAGAQIVSVSRVGLYLVAQLSDVQLPDIQPEDIVLVISLGASGSPRFVPSARDGDEDLQIRFTFADKSELHFVDPVGTGQLFLVPREQLELYLPESTQYGQDALIPTTWLDFGQRLRQSSTPLKWLLTDDRFVPGIGDVYSDEILFDAGLRFDRTPSTLSAQEIRRLQRSLRRTLFDAMKYGGTSVHSRPFVDPSGRVGVFAQHLNVWNREHERCPRCKSAIVKDYCCGECFNVWQTPTADRHAADVHVEPGTAGATNSCPRCDAQAPGTVYYCKGCQT